MHGSRTPAFFRTDHIVSGEVWGTADISLINMMPTAKKKMHVISCDAIKQIDKSTQLCIGQKAYENWFITIALHVNELDAGRKKEYDACLIV